MVTTLAGTGSQGNDLEGGRIGCSQEISSPWDIVIGNALFSVCNITAYPSAHRCSGRQLSDALYFADKLWNYQILNLIEFPSQFDFLGCLNCSTPKKLVTFVMKTYLCNL